MGNTRSRDQVLISSSSDLTTSNLQTVLRVHFGNPDLGVESVSEVKPLENLGDFYNSQVARATVTLSDGSQTHLVVKESLNGSVIHRLASRLTPTFLMETVMYTRVFPQFAKESPEFARLLPDCYYAYSSAVKEQESIFEQKCIHG